MVRLSVGVRVGVRVRVRVGVGVGVRVLMINDKVTIQKTGQPQDKKQSAR
jgi:hypothetical protein